MKYGVTKNTLLITAGIVWLLAGINILRIGISCWINDSHYWFFKVCELSILFLRYKRVDYHGIHDYHRYFDTHPAFTTGSIHCCILYRIVSSPNYNWYPIYMVLVEKQASTSLISHSVYRGFHDGCCFPLAQCQREPPKRNDSITNHSFKSYISRNV